MKHLDKEYEMFNRLFLLVFRQACLAAALALLTNPGSALGSETGRSASAPVMTDKRTLTRGGDAYLLENLQDDPSQLLISILTEDHALRRTV